MTKVIPDVSLIIGDIHLCRQGGNLLTFYYTEKFFEEQIIPEAKSLNDDNVNFTVIFMGDVWHSESLINTYIGSRFSKIVEKLLLYADSIIFLVGNHDTYKIDSNSDNGLNFYRGWNNVSIVEEDARFTTESGEIINFLSYVHDESKLIQLVKDMPENSYLYMHNEIQGFVYKGNDSLGALTPSMLSKFKRVIDGHIHSYQDVGNITITGSIEQNNFGERDNENYFFILRHKNNAMDRIMNVVSPKYKKVNWTSISTTPPAEFEQLYKNCRVKIYCENEQQKQDCYEHVKEVNDLLSLSIELVRVKKEYEEDEYDVELKSLDEDIEDTAVTMVTDMKGSEFNGYYVSDAIADGVIGKIKNYHKKLIKNE